MQWQVTLVRCIQSQGEALLRSLFLEDLWIYTVMLKRTGVSCYSRDDVLSEARAPR
jgi:hypothetical protein